MALRRDGREIETALARKLACTWQTVRTVYRQKEAWEAWGREQGVQKSLKPGPLRKRGQRVPLSRMVSMRKGCTLEKGRRGDLGRPGWHIQIVRRVEVWAAAVEQQGHELSRHDLLHKFRQYLQQECPDSGCARLANMSLITARKNKPEHMRQ